jgi:hypothetical protein
MTNISCRMMHVGLGRSHPLHVEYIHLGVCLSFIQDIMTEAILSHPRLALQRKIAIVKALGKLIWIQNDLFAKWHVRDGCEYASHEEAIIEDEGYLHGKKVLSEVDSSDADDEATTPTKRASVCPFSGVVSGMEEVKIPDEKPAEEADSTDQKPTDKVEENKRKSLSQIPLPTRELPSMTPR